MANEPLILAYARPSDAADAAQVASVFTFASPPPRKQILTLIACVIACLTGTAVFISLGVMAHFDQRRDGSMTVIGAAVAVAMMAGMIAYALRELVRLGRFGHENVRFEIRGDQLLAWAPQQWGLEPRALELEEIRDVTAAADADIGLVRTFEVRVRRHRWFTTYWSIRVAVADRGVLHRAVADLNHAIRTRVRSVTTAG